MSTDPREADIDLSNTETWPWRNPNGSRAVSVNRTGAAGFEFGSVVAGRTIVLRPAGGVWVVLRSADEVLADGWRVNRSAPFNWETT